MATVASCKKLVKSKSGLRIVFSDNSLKSPFDLDEPNWIPDKESPECSKCCSKFDFLTRRHHCRRCGLVYCNSCCMQKLSLPRMCFVDPVRQCEMCAKVTQKENEFYDVHLKALTSGANFILQSSHFTNKESKSFFSRLSSNHREILFDGGSQSHHEAVPLYSVISFKLVKSDDFQSAFENEIGGAELVYNVSDEKVDIVLAVPSVPNPKQSASWICALRKALKLLKDVEQE